MSLGGSPVSSSLREAPLRRNIVQAIFATSLSGSATVLLLGALPQPASAGPARQVATSASHRVFQPPVIPTPSFFSASPGGAGVVTLGDGSLAAQLTSGPEPPSSGFGYGGVNLDFPSGTTFASLTTLSTMYDMTKGTCTEGAPRFQIDLADGGGQFIGTLVAYFGPNASLNGDPCPLADNSFQEQLNVATNADPDAMRWDFQACTGTCPLDTPPANTRQSYAAGELALGVSQMLDVQIVVDGGYGPDNGVNFTQQVTLHDWDVNGLIFFRQSAPVQLYVKPAVDGGNDGAGAYPNGNNNCTLASQPCATIGHALVEEAVLASGSIGSVINLSAGTFNDPTDTMFAALTADNNSVTVTGAGKKTVIQPASCTARWPLPSPALTPPCLTRRSSSARTKGPELRSLVSPSRTPP